MLNIILASKSKVRKEILENHKITCVVEVSNVDEEPIKESLLKNGASPEIVSKNLAELKANKISQKRSDDLVLGADSVIDLKGKIISKPINRGEALEILDDFVYGPLFTPASLPDNSTGTRGTIFVPSAGGGANWPGAGVDPEANVLFVPGSNGAFYPFMGTLPEDESNFRFYRLANRGVPGPRGLPLLKPPYSTITAYDMDRGEILWQVPNGDGMARVENSSAVEGIDLPPLGGGGRHPVLVTATLLIHGQNAGYGPLLIALSLIHI